MRIAALVAALLLFGACGGGGGHEHGDVDAPVFEEADADTAVGVTLQDYAFVGIPESVAGPKVFVTASIKGSNSHELLVYDDHDELVGEIAPFKGEEERSTAMELEPGTYRVECLVEEGARTHADLGMKASLVVT